MDLDNIKKIIDRVIEHFSPLSIFLYDSRARDDFLPCSDYEIGVLFDKDNMVDECRLQETINADSQFKIYPYELESFISGNFDLPFETAIFLKKVAFRGATLWGDKVIENMQTPPVTVTCVMRDIKFQIGRASDAIVCGNSGYNKIAAQLFFKSCLLGCKDLVILEARTFPVSYKEILYSSKGIDLGEYIGITEKAYKARVSGVFEKNDLLTNVWFLNKFVERRIIETYRKIGDAVLIS